MIYLFLELDGTRIAQQHHVSWVGEGPPAAPDPLPGNTCVAVTEAVNLVERDPPIEPHWQDGAVVWVDPRPLDQVRTAKVAELSTACATHILSGFVSSALGAAYTYPSTILDQHNLNGLVTRSLYPGNPTGWSEKFWCADVDGVWARRDHTASQLQQVGDEAIVRITAAQAKCDSKIAQANAATLEQLATLTWDSV